MPELRCVMPACTSRAGRELKTPSMAAGPLEEKAATEALDTVLTGLYEVTLTQLHCSAPGGQVLRHTCFCWVRLAYALELMSL